MVASNNEMQIRDLRNGSWYWVQNIVYSYYAPKIGVAGVAIYNALCSYANQSGQCYPTHKTMAKKLGVSLNTLKKYLKILQDEKLISVESGKIKGKSNIYNLLKLKDRG